MLSDSEFRETGQNQESGLGIPPGPGFGRDRKVNIQRLLLHYSRKIGYSIGFSKVLNSVCHVAKL